MRFLRALFRFAVAVVLIAIGALFVFYEKKDIYNRFDQIYQEIRAQAPEGARLREGFGVVVVLGGLIAFVSIFWGRKEERSISFTGTHGDVTIELEPVESTLERVAAKLPEVKNISVQLRPMEGQGRIKVLATVILSKNADDDARMITARVNNYLQIHTRKILGLQDVEVSLKVRRFVMNMRSVKPDPLLLEAPAQAVADVPVPETEEPVAAEVEVVDEDYDIERKGQA